LFSFPISPIDFAGITLDLADMKAKAQANGIYYGPSGGYGYSIVFNGDGTATVRRVTGTYNYTSYSSSEGWHSGERNVITGSSFVDVETIDASCPVMFFEDKVWVQGTVDQKVTLAAANLSLSSQTNVVLSGNLTYAPNTEAGLLVLAEDDVDVGLNVPNNMTIQGIFIAQNGRFGRNHYSTSYLSGTYDPYVVRSSLDTIGTIVTRNRAVTRWVSGGTTLSGFDGGDDSFDPDQVDNPPPFTPSTSDVYRLINWRQDG
jgi:hypothetical protein